MITTIDEQSVVRTRHMEQLVTGQCSCNGAGVKLKRLLTRNLQHRLAPFLMFDAFARDTPDDCLVKAPDHPQRGFETITYMICGRMGHRDSSGCPGVLASGGVRWMSAGRGVTHCALPQSQDGAMEGFQLWLNLPGCDKMGEPWSRDFRADQLSRFCTSGAVDVIVIAGQSHGVRGAVVREASAPLYLDVHLPAGSRFEQLLPVAHNAFIYVYRGEVSIAGQAVPTQRMAILANDPLADGVAIDSPGGARVLLLAGQPLKEPIVQFQTFVMNTQKEVYQALSDYRDGCLAIGESSERAPFAADAFGASQP